MTIRPMLTYGYTVLWIKDQQDGTQYVTRLAGLVTRGVVTMAPGAAMEVLLNSLLLVRLLRQTPRQRARLMCSQQWKPKSTYFSHARKS